MTNRLAVTHNISVNLDEVEFKGIRAQGAGGQNVNKVSSAVHLRFDIRRSSLPDNVKSRLFAFIDHRITADGIINIKAQQHRSQELNKEDALQRLAWIIAKANTVQKKRKPTKPTRASQRKRLDSKKQLGKTKQLRGKIKDF